MADPVSIPALVARSWRLAARAAGPALPWLALLSLAGGFYQWVLDTGTGGTLMSLAALSCVFVAGVQASLTIYRAMMPDATGGFVSLARTNLAIYLVFLFVGVFIGFFLLILPGILLEASGAAAIGPETPPEEVQAALAGMLPTPYGAVLILACVAGALALVFLALRLLLAGAATVRAGQSMVFRTWGWTRGWVLSFGAASLATHIAPFALGVLANMAIMEAIGQSEPAVFFSGITGLALQAPFILAGHGLAVAALSARSKALDVA